MKKMNLLKSLFVTVFVFAANLTVFANSPETELIYNTEEIDGVKMSETVYKMNEGILTNFEKYNYKYNDQKQVVENIKASTKPVNIALVGKYVALHDAYLSVSEALYHGGFENHAKVNIQWIDSDGLENANLDEVFKDTDGIILPGGFGDRGIEGMISVANYARNKQIPYLGICLGMQIAAIAFARDVLGFEDANSYEFDSESKHTIIDFMEDQSNDIKKGGTMRLGSYPCSLKADTKIWSCYKKDMIDERHRHRYEFNNEYRSEFERNGMNIVGTSPDKQLVEAIEYTNHPFYIGVQYHPEFKSRPNRPHPLFVGLVKASLENKESHK
jgi:CTP synthase